MRWCTLFYCLYIYVRFFPHFHVLFWSSLDTSSTTCYTIPFTCYCLHPSRGILSLPTHSFCQEDKGVDTIAIHPLPYRTLTSAVFPNFTQQDLPYVIPNLVIRAGILVSWWGGYYYLAFRDGRASRYLLWIKKVFLGKEL
jgi:hypothetical protein